MIRRRAIESNWKISLRDLSQNEISTVDGKNKIREEKGEGFWRKRKRKKIMTTSLSLGLMRENDRYKNSTRTVTRTRVLPRQDTSSFADSKDR